MPNASATAACRAYDNLLMFQNTFIRKTMLCATKGFECPTQDPAFCPTTQPEGWWVGTDAVPASLSGWLLASSSERRASSAWLWSSQLSDNCARGEGESSLKTSSRASAGQSRTSSSEPELALDQGNGERRSQGSHTPAVDNQAASWPSGTCSIEPIRATA